MKVSIHADVFKKFHPQLKIAFVYLKKINNKAHLHESEHMLHEGEELVRLEFHPDTLKNHELISPWVAAQQEFGREAKHYHTSTEELLHRVLENKSVKVKDTLTNLLSYLSLKYVVPIGVDDVKKIDKEISFDIAKGNEKVGILSVVKRGAFYYHDASGVLGTKFDYWKSSRTKIDPKTTSVLIHIEAVPPLGSKELNSLLRELNTLSGSFCGGESKVFILDKNHTSFKI